MLKILLYWAIFIAVIDILRWKPRRSGRGGKRGLPFRNMLRYKCQKAGVRFEEASERYSTRACSACGSLSGPKGVSMLGIRHWICGDCGAAHDRDVNAALNILAGAERRPPVVEILAV